MFEKVNPSHPDKVDNIQMLLSALILYDAAESQINK